MPDVAPAESSPATLASLTPEQRENWRLTGDFPSDPDTQTPSAESSPAAPAEPAASTEVPEASASEADTPPKKGSKLAARHTELDTEIAELHRKLALRAELRAALRDEPSARPPAPPDASEAKSSPAPEPLDQLLSRPDITKPPLDDVEFFTAYPDATISQLSRYQARYEWLRGQAEATRASTTKSKVDAYVARRNAALAENPAFVAELHPRVTELVPLDLLPPGQTPHPLNVVAQEIFESEHSPKLMAYFSEHVGELDRLSTLSPNAIVREIGRIEGHLTAVPPVVTKTTTSAPEPAETLGKKPTIVVDNAESAVAAGDFRRYRATKNREEVAS